MTAASESPASADRLLRAQWRSTSSLCSSLSPHFLTFIHVMLGLPTRQPESHLNTNLQSCTTLKLIQLIEQRRGYWPSWTNLGEYLETDWFINSAASLLSPPTCRKLCVLGRVLMFWFIFLKNHINCWHDKFIDATWIVNSPTENKNSSEWSQLPHQPLEGASLRSSNFSPHQNKF